MNSTVIFEGLQGGFQLGIPWWRGTSISRTPVRLNTIVFFSVLVCSRIISFYPSVCSGNIYQTSYLQITICIMYNDIFSKLIDVMIILALLIVNFFFLIFFFFCVELFFGYRNQKLFFVYAPNMLFLAVCQLIRIACSRVLKQLAFMFPGGNMFLW